jgi:hypothetical protein
MLLVSKNTDFELGSWDVFQPGKSMKNEFFNK